MKPIRNLLFAATLIVFPVIIESCCFSGGCCGKLPVPKEFSISDVALTMSTNAPNGGFQAAPHSILPAAMNFDFQMNVAYVSSLHTYRTTMGAYACDPIPNHSKQKFTELKITSDKELVTKDGQTFAAGTDLSTLFSLNAFILNETMYSEGFTLNPTFSVTQTSEHNFHFHFVLDDGQKFDVDSGVFELLPQ